ncbi:MAG: cobyrinate a,c-diamide synthase [Desulfobulbaceae bacterium]|nr:cobyrinate a,c-diamide synthase [Desulfobulbaceae bacterium]
MTTQRQAFMLAATNSGAGKTTITLGLLAALRQQGASVQPFKCGPDFIDPTLHQMVSGRVSRNLDLRMCGETVVSNCFHRHGTDADIAIIEGVMGLFDGGAACPAALAKTLKLPVLLVVDAKACAESIAAVVKGFETLDPELRLMGVILNRVGSARHLELLSGAIRSHCHTPLLGHLPRNPDFVIPDRHLGLMMGDESPLSAAQINALADAVTQNIDLAAIQRLALIEDPAEIPSVSTPTDPHKVRIGIARDQAFCFYYQDNLDLLNQSGAMLVPFSPINDQTLPPDLDALYLGGGYPELHAKSLSENQTMLAEIRAWSEAGRPIYAECGGFLYLCQGITDLAGDFWDFAALFPVRARMRQRLTSLGYREATITQPCLLGTQGTLYGHEFHYSEIDEMPPAITRAFQLQDGRSEGYQIRNTLGGYLHLHFGQTPEAAQSLITLCREGKTQ